MFEKNLNEKGFSLIEIALILVIVGLLVGLGASMIGPMSRQAKYRETKNLLMSARESIVTYAVQRKVLPQWGNNAIDNAPVDEFCEVVGKRSDSLDRAFRYRFDSNLFSNLCGTTSGRITLVTIDTTTIQNVAFVIFSPGPDNRVNTLNIGNSGPVNANLTITQRGDDVVDYMTLNDLRAKAGCTKFDLCDSSGLTITNRSTAGNRLWYATNGSGCTQWNVNAAHVFSSGNLYDIYVNSACSSVTTTYITYTEQKEKVDLNNNCRTSIKYFPVSGQFATWDQN